MRNNNNVIWHSACRLPVSGPLCILIQYELCGSHLCYLTQFCYNFVFRYFFLCLSPVFFLSIFLSVILYLIFGLVHFLAFFYSHFLLLLCSVTPLLCLISFYFHSFPPLFSNEVVIKSLCGSSLAYSWWLLFFPDRDENAAF